MNSTSSKSFIRYHLPLGQVSFGSTLLETRTEKTNSRGIKSAKLFYAATLATGLGSGCAVLDTWQSRKHLEWHSELHHKTAIPMNLTPCGMQLQPCTHRLHTQSSETQSLINTRWTHELQQQALFFLFLLLAQSSEEIWAQKSSDEIVTTD